MALFTDGAVASIEELKGHDTQLLNVATVEAIDVTRKLALAQEELSVELTGLLRRLDAPPEINQVVVTPALKLWYVFRALELVYRDAYNSQLNDRYAGKRDEYHEMVKWAYEQLLRSGVGIAADPVARAATPEVRPWSGGLADGAYFVAVTWTNAAGEEGSSSTPAMIRTSGSSFAVETVLPVNVKGWNVYIGENADAMTMQNGATLGAGQVWVAPNTISTTGRPAGSGQAPTYRLAVPRTIQRG